MGEQPSTYGLSVQELTSMSEGTPTPSGVIKLSCFLSPKEGI